MSIRTISKNSFKNHDMFFQVEGYATSRDYYACPNIRQIWLQLETNVPVHNPVTWLHICHRCRNTANGITELHSCFFKHLFNFYFTVFLRNAVRNLWCPSKCNTVTIDTSSSSGTKKDDIKWKFLFELFVDINNKSLVSVNDFNTSSSVPWLKMEY